METPFRLVFINNTYTLGLALYFSISEVFGMIDSSTINKNISNLLVGLPHQEVF